MEASIFISMICITVIWIGVSNLLSKISDGKQAQTDLKKTRSELYDTKRRLEEELSEKKKLKGKIADLSECIRKKDALYQHLKDGQGESFEYISSLIADHLTLQYEISAYYLERKKRPARVEARRIKELRRETKEILYKNKLLQYKYEYLFQLFPDLELYVDSIEEINELSNLNGIGQLEDKVDRTRYYLSNEEYSKLSEIERNQLALDRYINSKKSKWQIGRDYELSVGYEYSKDGWSVDYFGIEKQIKDMGRDLIAKKGDVIHVIQCKYWSQEKTIHEKHIAQLYGTTVQFILSSTTNKEVVPVFITNIKLSNTAKLFAKHLNVKVIENRDMANFPRIKCNINRDQWGTETKIYHLPMDQQYDRTKICNPGEFFAFTVEEAVKAGFRRAFKWYGNG